MLKNALLKAVWESSRGWLCAILAFVLLTVALLIYQTQFMAAETERLQRREATLQQQLKNREAENEKSGVPVSAVEQMEKELRTFAEKIPPKQKFADFLGDLFHWADQAKLEIRQISYQPKIDKETNYLEYGLSFSVQGTYDQLKRFVHLLETSKRILIIDNLGLSGKRNKDNSAAVNLQINLTTFFQEGEP